LPCMLQVIVDGLAPQDERLLYRLTGIVLLSDTIRPR
jgi:hypothetical protein